MGFYKHFPPLLMTITIQRSPLVMVHACGRVAEQGGDTYYGNRAVMNVPEQLKLNLNCITCCFEYTSLICLSLMYYQVQGAELL